MRGWGENGRRGGKPSLAAAFDEARLRRLGASDDDPAEVVAALRREDPARVVPLAFATLCAIVCGIGGVNSAPNDFLESWGVISPEEAAEIAAEESMENLRVLAARLETKRNG